MQYVLLMITMLWVTSIGVAQQNPPQYKYSKEEYLKKSRTNKTVGWIMLGTGAAITATGLIIASSAPEDEFLPEETYTGGIAMGVGLLSMVGSVPFFIVSGNQARKAATMTAGIKMEKEMRLPSNGMGQTAYPAISVKLNF
jgi:hypothetical protein